MLSLKNKTLPGKRDEVYRWWDKHLRTRVEESKAQEMYFYCFDDNDPDTFFIFELYDDCDTLQKAGQTTWFAEYMKEVSPLLLEGYSDFAMNTPKWAKCASL